MPFLLKSVQDASQMHVSITLELSCIVAAQLL